jgi:hypothetical protein
MSKHTPIPGYPGYEASRDGRVFSVSSNWRGYGVREMRQTLNADGYPSVRVMIDGQRKRITVHRLIAAAFLPPRPSERHQVRHLDGDQLRSHADNLAWGTPKENAEDRDRHGRTSRGGSHSAKIKARDHADRVKRGADHYETKARMNHG